MEEAYYSADDDGLSWEGQGRTPEGEENTTAQAADGVRYYYGDENARRLERGTLLFSADNDLYTYEALIQKPDMVGTIIGDNEIPRKSDGQEYIVKSTVNHFGINKSVVDTVEIYDVLKGSKAKVVEPSVIGSHTEKTAASLLNASDSTTTISIAELLETVKDNYAELVPDEVRRHLNIENAPKDLDLHYAAEGQPTEKETVQRK